MPNSYSPKTHRKTAAYMTTCLLVAMALAWTMLPAQAQSDRSIIAGDGVQLEERVAKEAAPNVSPASVTPTPDPHLEPGFPVPIYLSAGVFPGRQALTTLVGNIDEDPTLEILITGQANGPLYAWNTNGSIQQGWPVPGPNGWQGAGYPVLGNLLNSVPGMEVYAQYYIGSINYVFNSAYTGQGTTLPGWPQQRGGINPPPVTADVDGDGIDEIFHGEGADAMHAYRADGTPLPGWPVYETANIPRGRSTPAIGDLDGDGSPEIVTVTGWVTGGVYVLAYHADGSRVAGFPVHLPNGHLMNFVAIGDVDGDGAREIVLQDSAPYSVLLLNPDGTRKRTIPLSGIYHYGSAAALADLDGDRVPEIVMQNEEGLDVFKGDGTNFPGWPRRWPNTYSTQGNSSPVVGDVNGDGYQDIVIVTGDVGSGVGGDVRVFDRFGEMLPGFPKELPLGGGQIPAVADIDLDGRNEIIISGSYWDGYAGEFDQLWVFDLRGPAAYSHNEWGQFGGGPQHQGLYRPFECTNTFLDVPPGSTFYPFVTCLASRGIISGYSNCTFRPGNNVTRGQLSKIVANAAGMNEPVSGQTFEDVPPTHTFYEYIERMAARGVIGGYPCGSSGEPCTTGRPYFRPSSNATRGQISKIVSNAAGFGEPPGEQLFEDVAVDSAFYEWVQRLGRRAVIGGYPCGGPGEPCISGRPYFRPGNNATRGQVSKIVSSTFFPNCEAPWR